MAAQTLLRARVRPNGHTGYAVMLDLEGRAPLEIGFFEPQVQEYDERRVAMQVAHANAHSFANGFNEAIERTLELVPQLIRLHPDARRSEKVRTVL